MTHTNFDETHVGHPINELAGRLLDRVRMLRRRRKFKSLLDLDDHLLKDIGVTRGEVEMATGLPYSIDAATELRRMSLDRRKRLM